ncbi:MAG: hypothetical protein QNK05_04290 [Myxococcota bacterium]|nr:hypothetical protein [Myxococcota bacterium]
MRRIGIVLAVIAALGLAVVLGHLALIEVGREVVTLRTPLAEGEWRETRLWIVDDGDVAWLHSAGPDWLAQFEGEPVVEVDRGGGVGRYRATLVPGPHERVDALLREKYGVADRWVRLLAPCTEDVVPVRLERE